MGTLSFYSPCTVASTEVGVHQYLQMQLRTSVLDAGLICSDLLAFIQAVTFTWETSSIHSSYQDATQSFEPLTLTPPESVLLMHSFFSYDQFQVTQPAI